MLSKAETDLLCQVGPGTPMGDVFRRFWIPVLLAEELPEPDSDPVAIRILGEDLLAFRATSGKVGLTSAYCAHRHAHLFWGRNEQEGIRCTYHGWKYDTGGQCVDMPNEPGDLSFKDKIKLRAYPTREAGGCIWAYMGPPEDMPEMQQLEWTLVPRENVLVTKRLQENNWAQAVEGGIDSSHISYLHNNNFHRPNNQTADKSPQMTVSRRDFGFIEAARRVTNEGKHYWRVRPFLVPSSIIIPSGDQPGRNLSGHVWVPVDDDNVWVFTMTWNAQRPLTQEEVDALLSGTGIHCPVDKEVGRWDLKISRGYKPIRNIDNQYMINRSLQRERSFTGINGTSEQDCSIQESMGRISPRWEEHLGTADRGIIEFRRILLQLARDMQAGKNPEHASRAEAYRVRSTAFVVEPETDWESSAAEHMKALA
ncbi:MAG TPA: Rieske 2Fe-2S domain-containing protein [Chloroflexota bacterium]|jgi:phenylpropionate dioxygenase-like ring-hydroxylating dioxygenase large terminal subunit